MAVRPSRTPLYELMRQARRPRAEVEPPREIVPDDEERGSGWPAWLTPGQAVRMPAGYVLVALAIVALAIVLAYVTGYKRAEHRITAGYEALLLDQSRRSSAALGLEDPLDQEIEAGGGAGAGDDPGVLAVPEPRRGPTPGAPAAGPVVVQVGQDPREPGLHYFVIAETREGGAIRLAEFCREKGLEAYVVPRHNSRLCRVIVLPGFSTRLRSEAVARLEQRIFEVGAQWKANERGASDLRDAYMALYDD